MRALADFNNKISLMVSNAAKVAMSSHEKREEVINYALIAFLRNHGKLDVTFDNFKMIVHLYYMTLCNGFGIADD